MLPLPAATTTIANMSVTSQPVLNAFLPYGYLQVGVFLGALLIIFLIYVFWDALSALMFHIRALIAHKSVRKFDSPSQHRDAPATSAAIAEHRRYLSLTSNRNKNRVSRYD